MTTKSKRKVIMNLGCGNKLRVSDGNTIGINIDVVSPNVETIPEGYTFFELDIVNQESLDELPNDGTKFFVFHKSDITKLNFVENDIADGIEAYHVIEHFFIYEAPVILLHWKSKLKDTGWLALEQPDILKCAINMLQYATTGQKTIAFNLGLMGFYGKQDPKEPLMAHKWGYFPDSLAELLRMVGFDSIEEQPATTHASTTRDFRLVAKIKEQQV